MISLYYSGKPGGWVVVRDFDYNTSTAQLVLGLGLTWSIMYSKQVKNHSKSSVSFGTDVVHLN